MNDKKILISIKVSNPTTADIEYIQMLLENWNNYYKPENYLLPNTEIVEPGDHPMSSIPVAPNHQESLD